MVRDTHTYVCRPGNAVYWLFFIWKENIRLCTQLTADRLTAGNSNSALYIGLTRGKGGRNGRGWHPVTRQTSDGSGINGEYWLEILEILKRSRSHALFRRISLAYREIEIWHSHIIRIEQRARSTGIWNVRVILLRASRARFEKKKKKKRKPDYTYVRDISRKSNKKNLIEL